MLADRGLYDRRRWEADTFEMCGCRVQQKRDGNVEVDQTESARALQTIPVTEHRRRQQRVVLSRHAQHQVITKEV